jgi:Zn-dependent protease with chaperone function
MNNKIILKKLKPEHFMHPGDRLAIKKLKSYDKFREIMQRLLVEGLEDDMYLMSLADNVKLGPKQGEKIYNMLIDASKILDMKPPVLFMDTDPTPNAFAFGEKKPIITLTSGLVDTFSDDEIFAVIGHELGHIKCQHTLYSLMAQNIMILMQILSLFPIVGMLGYGFYLSLLAWYRRSELSADRAALLVTQSDELISRTMMKLAGGGSNKIYETLSLESFMEQADEYEKLQIEILNSKAYKKWAYIFGTLMATVLSTHPWPTLRTKEAIRFYNGKRYKDILTGKYTEEQEKAEGIFASEGLTQDINIKTTKEDLKEIGGDIKNQASKYGNKAASFLSEKLKKIAEDMSKKND